MKSYLWHILERYGNTNGLLAYLWFECLCLSIYTSGPIYRSIVGGAVDALIKMITFYQRLDYVYVSLYQPLAGTLAQIMVSVGFIIGVCGCNTYDLLFIRCVVLAFKCHQGMVEPH